ncbi:MAG TPA: integrase arm-type DNA-binding domain-containing protein [Methylophilaceae bacterium]|nr:integrase arm-type DNA-binding domain-containing protein [Methylophilaceae bacterium]
MLTSKQIDGAKPKDRQYKLYDADSLYLIVTPRSVKSWRTNYKIDGKSKTKTFGLYPEISLAKARLLNSEFKDFLASGMARSMPTFDALKADWYKHKLPGLKNIKHKQTIMSRVDTYVSPVIGKKVIDTIKRADLVDMVQKIQAKGISETAHRVAMHVRQILDYAVDIGKLENHPAVNLSRVLQAPKVTHMPCVSIEEAPQLFKDIMAYTEPITRIGLMLTALTMTRTGEIRWWELSEIRDKTFWVIPEVRMKMGKIHVVPLSKFALQLLDEINLHTGDYKYVLNSPTRPAHPISENTMLFGLYRLGYRNRMTVHGFRALASTVLNEQSPFSRDVIERQLAHQETDAVRKAYNRAEYLEERVKLMDWWAEWILAAIAKKPN